MVSSTPYFLFIVQIPPHILLFTVSVVIFPTVLFLVFCSSWSVTVFFSPLSWYFSFSSLFRNTRYCASSVGDRDVIIHIGVFSDLKNYETLREKPRSSLKESFEFCGFESFYLPSILLDSFGDYGVQFVTNCGVQGHDFGVVHYTRSMGIESLSSVNEGYCEVEVSVKIDLV